MENSPIIKIENLKKFYPVRDCKATGKKQGVSNRVYQQNLVLDIENLDFFSAKMYALVGPNGAGKTTLLNMIGFLEQPDAGRILFKGQSLNLNGKTSIMTRRKITLLSQEPYLFHTTVFHNIAYGLRLRSMDKQAIEKKVYSSLELVGLSGFAERKAFQLSGGEAQRVALARALALEPEVLLLDEPTANIDQQNTNFFEGLIKRISSEFNTTIILTTHDLVQAYGLAEEIILLIDGRPIEKKPDNIFNGQIQEANGLKWVSITKDLKIAVVTEKKGSARILIEPEDIIISFSVLDSSARNSFLGKITKIIDIGQQVRVFIDAGVEFVALISKKSFAQMGLNVGCQVYLSFKTSAVHVF